MGENDVVNGVECIDPLPLRAQVLLEQSEVFHGQRQLFGASLKKIQLLYSPLAAGGVAESSGPIDGFIARHRHEYKLPHLFGLKAGLRLGKGGISGSDLSVRLR